MTKSEDTWSVGEAKIQGKPVVYKFINALPDEDARSKFRWLTVVSWKYDGSKNNGMPPKPVNESMIKLEDGLEEMKGHESVYYDVYSASGNDLKEFVFYITDREIFMSNFNEALKEHPKYPLEINFYEDAEWSDLKKLHKDFGIESK